MPEHLAVIDCGTNTFNLLIVEPLQGGAFRKVYNTRVAVRLGEGAINQGYIAPLPFQRGLSAIESFVNEIKRYKVSTSLAFATSAIRDAKNGSEFVRLVNEKHGINIQIIDGNREATLIAYGVMAAVKQEDKRSLIMDIGGGSTEFIIIEKGNHLWKHSFDLGAARILERFKPSECIQEDEAEAIKAYLKLKLEPLIVEHSSLPCTELIGSSGAFDSVVEMIHGELGGEAFVEHKTEYNIDLANYKRIAKRVLSSTLEERRRIKGLVAMRVDMIVISCLLIDFILNEFKLPAFRVSTYSLKEGALVDHLQNKSLTFDQQ
jgi:exopolyphosphatase / guanosine-5'-triphosphate,3'-diphosphate pyrophosphatase